MSSSFRRVAKPLPASLEHLISLNTEYHVLVCPKNECRQAVEPKAFSGHLLRIHKTKLELRRQVEAYVADFPHLYTYKTIPLPPDGSRPQPLLPVSEALHCKHCTDRSRSRKLLREHCNKVHQLQRKKDEELFRPVKVQSWFQDRRERYWVVNDAAEARPATATAQGVVQGDGDLLSGNDGGGGGGGSGDSSGEDDNGVEDQIAQEMQNWTEEVKERRLKLLAKVPVAELDSWLRFTGWNAVLLKSKHDIVQTYRFLRKPDPDEPELERLLVCWTRNFNRCLDTLAVTDNPDVLKWFASPKNESMSKRPFQLPQNAQTVSKYSGLWEHFICYAMRTAPLDVDEEETATGIYFPMRQRIAIHMIREMLKTNCLDDEYTDDSERDRELTEALMHFCWMVLLQNMERETVYRSPLMHFLAVMGIDSAAEVLRHSFVYTPYLAGVLWVNRLLMLEYALPLRAWPVTKLAARADVTSVRARVKEVREKRLCEGSFSPTSFILGQLAYGKMLNRTYTAQSNIHWSEDFQTLFFKGRPIEIRKLQDFGSAVVAEARAALQQLTFGTELPTIDLGKVTDTMSWSSELRKSAYSFVTDKRFGLNVGFQFLLQRARQAPKDLQLLKKTADGKEGWNARAVHSYLANDKRFLRKLMVALHVISLPGRGSEIGSIKFANSIYSARNIYVLNGRMAFVTCYDKSRSRRMTTEYVVRYLPDELSQVLAQYMAFVCPFARNIGREESEYLFVDKRGPWAGGQLSAALAEATALYLGVRLPVSEWRHVAIAVGDRFLHKGIKAFRDQGVSDAGAKGDDDGDSSQEDEKEIATMAEVQARQAGHGLRVARAHYAVDGAFLSKLGPELLWEFQRASLAWHELLKLESTGGKPSQTSHRRLASQELPSDGGKKSRLVVGSARVKTEDEVRSQAEVGLRKVFGPAAVPRSSDQLDALQLVLNPPKTSIIVMRTAGGKSALFLVPAALADQKTIIVIVPYTALADDLFNNATLAGIDCKRWSRDYADGELHALVVVSADIAVDDDFLHYAQGLQLAGRLKLVVFDEGHVAFTDTSYRLQLRELWSLRYLDVPFICLTATLPVVLEQTLRERLCIPHAVIFRRPTWRRTIRYCVVDTGTEPAMEAALTFIESIQLQPSQRGIVYVRSYEVGQAVSEALGCPFYKAKAYDKATVLQDWVQRGHGWIVATGALGTGVNMPGIVYVIHVGRPYGMTSFVQQSGRGGRNGEVSDSVVFVGVQTTRGWRRSEVVSAYTVEQVDEDALTEYLQAQCCRRETIAGYMDGLHSEVDCSSIDGILCDYCSQAFRAQAVDSSHERVQAEEDSGAVVIQRRLHSEGIANKVMMEAVQLLSRRCVYCEVTVSAAALEAAEPHGYHECLHAAASTAKCGYDDFRGWRKQLQLPEYLHCWFCGLPQWVCQVKGVGERCSWPDVVLPVVYVLHRKGFFVEHVGAGLGYRGQSDADLREWLGSIVEGTGQEETYLTAAFRRFAELYVDTDDEYTNGEM